MILTKTVDRKHFIGCLNADSELTTGMRQICIDNSIFCGVFSGIGYLKNVELRTFDAIEGKFTEPILLEGSFQIATLTGNISLSGKKTSIRAHLMGMWRKPDAGKTDLGTSIGGEIVRAEVIGFEFTLEEISDIKLYREVDERSGLDGWLHLEFSSNANPIVERQLANPDEPDAHSRHASNAPKGAPQEEEADEGIEKILAELKVGDILNHPTLGACELISTELAERLQVKLGSGRIIELHTGLIDIVPTKDASALGGDAAAYDISIRRRH